MLCFSQPDIFRNTVGTVLLYHNIQHASLLQSKLAVHVGTTLSSHEGLVSKSGSCDHNPKSQLPCNTGPPDCLSPPPVPSAAASFGCCAGVDSTPLSSTICCSPSSGMECGCAKALLPPRSRGEAPARGDPPSGGRPNPTAAAGLSKPRCGSAVSMPLIDGDEVPSRAAAAASCRELAAALSEVCTGASTLLLASGRSVSGALGTLGRPAATVAADLPVPCAGLPDRCMPPPDSDSALSTAELAKGEAAIAEVEAVRRDCASSAADSENGAGAVPGRSGSGCEDACRPHTGHVRKTGPTPSSRDHKPQIPAPSCIVKQWRHRDRKTSVRDIPNEKQEDLWAGG